MTPAEIGGLLGAVKRSRSARVGVAMFLRHNAGLSVTPEMFGLAVGCGRTPFPSIQGLPQGPFPVDKARPFWDARLWESPAQRAWEAEMLTL